MRLEVVSGGRYNFRRAANRFASFVQSDTAWQDLKKNYGYYRKFRGFGPKRLKKKKAGCFRNQRNPPIGLSGTPRSPSVRKIIAGADQLSKAAGADQLSKAGPWQ
jgi:hypothetical protein